MNHRKQLHKSIPELVPKVQDLTMKLIINLPVFSSKVHSSICVNDVHPQLFMGIPIFTVSTKSLFSIEKSGKKLPQLGRSKQKIAIIPQTILPSCQSGLRFLTDALAVLGVILTLETNTYGNELT
jgi:hypothetical protein